MSSPPSYRQISNVELGRRSWHVRALSVQYVWLKIGGIQATRCMALAEEYRLCWLIASEVVFAFVGLELKALLAQGRPASPGSVLVFSMTRRNAPAGCGAFLHWTITVIGSAAASGATAAVAASSVSNTFMLAIGPVS